MKRMLDLCSGFGGASEAFFRSGRWDVVRIDNNPAFAEVPNTIIEDIRRFDPARYDGFDLVWASPPCLDFSRGYNAPAPTALRAGIQFEPDMSVVEACRAIMERHSGPWVLENVSGASRIFTEYLKRPWSQKIGPYFLWGDFPKIGLAGWRPKAGKTQSWNIGDPLRSNKRAIIPFEVSSGLLNAIEGQRLLTEWL